MDDTLQELVNGEKIYGEQIRGVVYFEGFDFPNYEAERLGIEPMLEETYVLLKEYYAAENQPDKKPVPFVFLGQHCTPPYRVSYFVSHLHRKFYPIIR